MHSKGIGNFTVLLEQRKANFTERLAKKRRTDE